MTASQCIAIFIGSYGVVFIHFALAIFFISKKRHIHYVSGFFLLDFGIMCACGGFYMSAERLTPPLILSVFIPMVILAPLGTIFALTCLCVRENRKRLLGAVIGGTVIVFGVGLFFIIMGKTRQIVFGIVYGWLLATFIDMVLFAVKDLRPLASLSRGLKFFLSLVCVSVLQVAVLFVATIFANDALLFLGWVVLIFCILAMALSAFRSPQTYSLLQDQVTKNRYEKTKLGNVSVGVILEKLEELMERENLFRDQDLSLEKLGKRLGMSAAQTSEILNTYAGKNFASYVNGFRIEFAKKILLTTELSMIEVAFDSGFNSKSVFNAAFLKHVGMSPSEFRRTSSE